MPTTYQYVYIVMEWNVIAFSFQGYTHPKEYIGCQGNITTYIYPILVSSDVSYYCYIIITVYSNCQYHYNDIYSNFIFQNIPTCVQWIELMVKLLF